MSEYEDSKYSILEYEDAKYSISLEFSLLLGRPHITCEIKLHQHDENKGDIIEYLREIQKNNKNIISYNKNATFNETFCQIRSNDTVMMSSIISNIFDKIPLNETDIKISFYKNSKNINIFCSNTPRDKKGIMECIESNLKKMYIKQQNEDYSEKGSESYKERQKINLNIKRQENTNINYNNNIKISKTINININNQNNTENNNIKISETEKSNKSRIFNEQAKEELLAQNKDKNTTNIISDKHYNSNIILSCLNCCNYNYGIPNSKNEIQVPQNN